MVTNPVPTAAARTPQAPVLTGVTDGGVANFEAAQRTFAQMVQDRAAVEPEEVAFCQWDGTHAVPTTWAQYASAVLGVRDSAGPPGAAAGEHGPRRFDHRADRQVALVTCTGAPCFSPVPPPRA